MSKGSWGREVVVSDHIKVMRPMDKVKRSDYLPEGCLPVVGQGAGLIGGYVDDIDRAYDGPLPVVVFGDHTCALKYVDFRFAVGADGTQLIRPRDEDEFHPRYLYYCLRTVPIEQFGYQRHFKYLKESTIPWRPMPVQRKIAAVLSAYDDLIENNLRRIKILEELAQLIYREWFVKFRFPGHEKVRMLDSPLGQIPEGWSVKPVEAALAHHIGGGWGKETADEKHVVPGSVIRGTDIPAVRRVDVSEVPFRYHTTGNLRSRRLKAGDIVIEVSGGGKTQAVGRTLFVTDQLLHQFDHPVICASFCKKLTVDRSVLAPVLLAFHLYQIYENGKINQYQVQSTGIKNFKFAVFLEKELLAIPPGPLQRLFVRHTSALVDLGQNLGAQNAVLQGSRDLLLPELVSGKLDVQDMEVR